MIKFIVISFLMHLILIANLASKSSYRSQEKVVEVKIELIETEQIVINFKANAEKTISLSKIKKSEFVTNELAESSVVVDQGTNQKEKQYIADYSYFDSSPSLQQSPKIKYPERMKFLDKEGSVKIRVLVTEEGVISAYEVVYFTNDDFKQEALKSINEMKFNPLKKDGTIISAWIDWDIEFKL